MTNLARTLPVDVGSPRLGFERPQSSGLAPRETVLRERRVLVRMASSSLRAGEVQRAYELLREVASINLRLLAGAQAEARS